MLTYLENLATIHAAEERRQERHLAALEAEDQLVQLLEQSWETADPYQTGRVDAGLGSAANDLLHFGAYAFHAARPGSRRDGDLPPFYRTEQQHWQIIDAARVLEAFCPTACNVLDVLQQFCVYTGFSYTIVPREKDGPKELVKRAQRAVDRWRDLVDWYGWECEIFRRTRRDGEAFLVMEEDDVTGLINLRSVEPEQVKQPQDIGGINNRLRINGNSSWKYGILTTKENTAVADGYWVVSQHTDAKNRGEFYEAREMIHVKTEWVDRQAKRGVSDFFSVANDIPGTKKLLRNLRESATVQACIAWIREHPEGMAPMQLGSNLDATNRSRTGVRIVSQRFDGPSMLDISHGGHYEPGPLARAGRSDVLIKVLQAALRSIGARWQMPEGVVSGDASNANLASALVAEGPFVRALQHRQWFYRNAYKRVIERIVDHAAVTGVLGGARENILEEIEVKVECQPVVARKLWEETQRNALLNKSEILGKPSWSSREDLDYKDEQADITEDPPTAADNSRPDSIKAQPEGERVS